MGDRPRRPRSDSPGSKPAPTNVRGESAFKAGSAARADAGARAKAAPVDTGIVTDRGTVLARAARRQAHVQHPQIETVTTAQSKA